MITCAELVSALACGRAGCRCARAVRQGNGLVHCPAHQDRDASLSVGDKLGKVVFKCMASCSQDRVMKALRERGLWGNAGSNGRDRQVVATYPYRDETGNLLYEVRRYHPKDFRPYLPNSNTPGLNGTRRVLYRLPEVLAHPDRAVFLVEGEKDADNLAAHGCIATTNAGGAEAWRTDYAESLKGRTVYVLPDNDDAGRSWADRVAQSLAGNASVLKVVTLPNLPPKGDVSDWLNAGGTLDTLKTIVKDTVVWTAPATDDDGIEVFSDIAPEPITWLWRWYIPLGEVIVVDGDPGAGKSTFTVDLASRLSTGRAWPDGSPGSDGAVLLVSAEDSKSKAIRPRLDAAGANVSMVFTVTRAFDLVPDDLGWLERMITKYGFLAVVIDPIDDYIPTTVDSHKNASVRKGMMRPLSELAHRLNVSIILIRHFTKDGKPNPLYRGQGSVGIIGAVRHGLMVTKDPNDENKRVLANHKHNYSPAAPSLSFQFQPVDHVARIDWLGGSDYSARDLMAAEAVMDEPVGKVDECARDLIGYFGEAPSVDAREARKDLGEQGYSEPTLRRARHKLGIEISKVGFQGKVRWVRPPTGFPAAPAPTTTTTPR